jgi:hypothetical protein
MPCRPLLCNQSFINPTVENQLGPVQLIPYTTTKLARFDLILELHYQFGWSKH